MRVRVLVALSVWFIGLGGLAAAQTPPSKPDPAPILRPPTRADILRGEYGRYRANNDLRHYTLDVRVDPDRKILSGVNRIRFRMLRDDTRIQVDLYANLNVDRIVLGTTPLTYTREFNAVFVEFPETLRAGHDYTIDFHYSGKPMETGRFPSACRNSESQSCSPGQHAASRGTRRRPR